VPSPSPSPATALRLDVDLPDGAVCANHSDRPAARACARCGTFVCSGCTVSGDLCHDCKRILLREGTPWSPEEVARAAARRGRRRAGASLRLTLGLGLAAGLAGWASGTGRIGAGPGLGQGLAVACVLAGAVASSLAGFAWWQSEQGRPGPAVAGVVPGRTAAILAGLGLAPAAIAGITALLRFFP